MFEINPLTRKNLLAFVRSSGVIGLFLILVFLYLLSLAGELFVNNRALIVSYNNEIFFPTYGEQMSGKDFGLDYEYEVDYRELKKKFNLEDSGNWVANAYCSIQSL